MDRIFSIKYNIMIKNKVSILFTAFFMLVFSIHHGYAQDRNVYIFLCFGQSNMEGTGQIEVQDTIADIRLLHLQAVDCPDLGRQKGHWYKAKSPLCHCNTGVSPAEQFGNALVQ